MKITSKTEMSRYFATKKWNYSIIRNDIGWNTLPWNAFEYTHMPYDFCIN